MAGKYARMRWVFDDTARPLLDLLMSVDPENFETIVDGGANHGVFSRAFLRISPNAQVIGIEPMVALAEGNRGSKAARACLRDLNRLRDRYPGRFRILGLALSDREETRRFFITQADGCSSLLQPPDVFLESFEVMSEDLVTTTTLDKLVEAEQIGTIDLLKLDLQGAEMLALRGAEKALGNTKNVLLELNLRRVYKDSATTNEITEFLAERGFRFAKISNVTTPPDGSIAQCDAFFTRAAQPK
jgi:FkbM family methyltransferase